MSLEALVHSPMREVKLRDDLTVLELGVVDYHKALALQERLSELRRANKIPNTVILLEHPHVYTIGKDVKDNEVESLVREELGAEIIQVQRGGKITYHGPGQLVAYFICKIPFDRYPGFLTQIEDVAIETLKSYGIKAYSRKEEIDPRSHGKVKGIRGAWCYINRVPKKIAAQGLEFRGTPRFDNEPPMISTMHGFALNVNTDLAYFQRIYPCGFDYDVMSSMKEIKGEEVDMEKVRDVVRQQLKERVGLW